MLSLPVVDGKLPMGFPEIQQYPELKAVERERNAIMQCRAAGEYNSALVVVACARVRAFVYN